METLSIVFLSALILVSIVGLIVVLILLWQKSRLSRKVSEAEARADALLPLKKYEVIVSAEAEASRLLAQAHEAAASIRAEAVRTREAASTASNKLSREASEALETARAEAANIISAAYKRAEEIAADAYEAKRNKDSLERAATAIRNIIEGYGDQYVIPSVGLLDDLANEFGYSDAGKKLALARANTKNMVKAELAATCEYKEETRRVQAINFVLETV